MSERIWSEIRVNHFDETEQVYTVDAWTTDDDNEEGKVIAKVYPSTCNVEYIDKRAENDPYVRETIRNEFEKIHNTKIILTKKVSDKIRKIAEMNEEIKRLAHEVNTELDKIGYATEYAYADDDFPIQAITNQDIITPEFKNDGDILVDGTVTAKTNNDGVYVNQNFGACEDNCFGETYIKMDDGKYVRIHFEV